MKKLYILALILFTLFFILFYIFFPSANKVIYKLRLTRLIFVLFVGSGLSIISFILQSLTRNPLSSEYTLGISSAVSFFASLAYILDLNPLNFSIVGGLLVTIFFVFVLRKKLSSNTLILLGISLNIFFNAGISFINYITSFKSSQVVSRWIFGSFSFYSLSEILILITLFLILSLFFYTSISKIVLISISRIYEDILGKSFRNQSILIILTIGIFVSFSTTFVGPIPFFALIISNIVRLIFKSNMVYTFISLLFSGILLVFLDFIGKNIVSFEEIPIGILTGVVCLPFFLIGFIFNSKRFY